MPHYIHVINEKRNQIGMTIRALARKANMDDEIYGKAFALNLKRDKLNDYVKEYINELLDYYAQNKTFDGYKQSKEQILIILKLIE